jgi:hypothetical protein
MLWPPCIALRVAGRHHKLSERLRVEHVRFEGGSLRLKLIPPLLRRFHETMEQTHNLSVVLLGHRIVTSLLAHASCRSQPFSWGLVSQGLVGKKNLRPIWHTGGMN